MRIYELAKELNTNSKTLMDKLKAINIDTKNHMSILDDAQLKAIYDYFGVKVNNAKTEPQQQSQIPTEAASSSIDAKKAEASLVQKQDTDKQKKNAPRIIRTEVREIRTDTMTGITTEIRTEIKGDHRREVRTTNISSPNKETPRNDKKDYFEFKSPETRKKVYDMKIENNKPEFIPSEVNKEIQDKKIEHKEAAANDIKDKIEEQKTVEKPKKETDKIKEQKAIEKPANLDAAIDNSAEQENKLSDKDKSRAEVPAREKVPDRVFNVEQKRQDNRPYNRPDNNRTDNRPYNRPDNNRQDNRPYNRPDNNRPDNRPYNRPDNNRTDNRPYNRPDNNRPDNRPYNRPDNFQGRPYDNRPRQGPAGAPGGPARQGGPSGAGGGYRPDNRFGNRKESGSIDDKIKEASKDMPKIQTPEHKPAAFRDNNVKDKMRDSKKEAAKPNKFGKQQGTQKFDEKSIKTIGTGHKVSDILNDDSILMQFYDAEKSIRKKRNQKGKVFDEKVGQKAEPVKVVLKVVLPEFITVKDLGEKIKKQASEIIKKLFVYGIMATLNQEIDYDSAAIVAEEFGYIVEKEVVVTEEDILFDDTDDKEEEMQTRAPIVVVMGHVDHGKTSLLDAIREANVIESEAGGITQHIGAYSVKVNNRRIAFLDTPGHEAFTAMRARGAQVTDIAILVVAADDGVMPQTIEAINHAKAANVSIIVAVNKIDKPGADPDRVKQELMQHGLVPEEWGGDTIFVNVSAKKREGIENLLEMVILVSDMMNLRANPNKQAKGTVIEAKLDKGRGPIATVLVQRGTLKVGDAIVAGTAVGRIRAMVDDKGQKVKKAKPSTPVEIIGLPDVPEAGDIFYAVEDEKVAKQLAEKRRIKQREETLNASSRVTLEDLYTQIQQGKLKDLNVIVKADVQGSVEAVKQSLEKIVNPEVRVKIIHGAVGAITESDVMLANVTNAIIIGFNVRPEPIARTIADRENVDIKLYRVIYEAIDDITAAMKGMLEPKFKEVIIGHVEIRQIFKASGIGTIAGSYVTDGKITRNSDVRIIRNGIVAFEGKISSLKRFKDDAKEVLEGFECGISLEKFNDIKEGDIIEAYAMEKIAVE
ncbi:MAG: translation initiation factor IF-2 [Deltaproteobacteria bacterium]